MSAVTGSRDWRLIQLLSGRFLRPYWRWMATVTLLNLITGVALTLRPLVLAPLLDSFAGARAQPAERLRDVTLNNLGPTLARFLGIDPANGLRTGLTVAGLLVGITLVVAIVGFASAALLNAAQTAIRRDLLVALHAHLLTLPLAYFHKRRTGELVVRLMHDVGSVSTSFDMVARGILLSLAQILMALLVMFRTDAWFSLSIVAMGGVHLVITKTLSGRVRRLAAGVTDRHGDVGARLHETFTGIRTIKSFAAERFDARRFREVTEKYRRDLRRSGLTGEADAPIRTLADSVVAAVVLVLTFRAVSQGRLTLPAAVLFFYLSQQLLAPISQVFRQWLHLSHLLGGPARILETLDQQSSMPDGARQAGPLEHAITLEGVRFAYETGRPVLEGVDLEIRQGETVAIVGPSGSGKTTLADLVLRLFDPDEGAVRYDGTDVRQFTQASYRRHFGVVAQDTLLFNTTVRENIVFNRPEDPERLARAVWVANAEEFVRELPLGLETMVGDRGVRLSGGQRQRIAIARAVYGHPSVLVLDEATSALDSEAEREVQQAIERVGREMTLLVIAHRLSTIVHADKVVVLNRGRIEAEGPHNRLLEMSPTYQRLYALQMATVA